MTGMEWIALIIGVGLFAAFGLLGWVLSRP